MALIWYHDSYWCNLRSGNSEVDLKEKYFGSGTEKWNIDVEKNKYKTVCVDNEIQQ